MQRHSKYVIAVAQFVYLVSKSVYMYVCMYRCVLYRIRTSLNEEKEIIISRAGNSGGATAASSKAIFTLWEVTGLIVVLVIIEFFIWRRCKEPIY